MNLSRPSPHAAPHSVPKSRVLPRFALIILQGALLCLALPLCASSQQIPQQELRFDTQPYTPPAKLRVRTNVVLMDVVVRDAKGQPVPGLTENDFKVSDKGKEQALNHFAVVNTPALAANSEEAKPNATNAPSPTGSAAPPRYISLFFDDRSTPFSDLRYAQEAAEKFVRENLHQGDKVGIFTASETQTLDFTTDAARLIQAIELIHLQPLGSPVSGCPGAPREFPLGPYAAYLIIDENDVQVRNLYLCGADTPGTEGETEVLAQSVLNAAELISRSSLANLDNALALLSRMPGRRILILTSSGFFTASLQPQIGAITSNALAVGVVINSLDAKGLVARAPGGDAKDSPMNNGAMGGSGLRDSPLASGGAPPSELEKELLKKQREEMDDVMVSLARDTGGIFFHNNNDLDFGLREMAEVPEVSYRLGFSPANLKPDGKFHDLKVKLAIPGSFQIQARRGYFAPTEAAAKAESEVNTFNDEVMKSDELHAFPAEVGAQAGRLPAGGTGLQVSLRVDPKSLSFQKDHGKHLDKLNLIVALFTTDGRFVTGELGVVDMTLSNQSLDSLTQRGLNATIVLPAAEGNYRLRVVMEDAASGKLFATSRPTNIP